MRYAGRPQLSEELNLWSFLGFFYGRYWINLTGLE